MVTSSVDTHSPTMGHLQHAHHKTHVSKLKKIRTFLKSLRSRVNRKAAKVQPQSFLPTVSLSPQQPPLCPSYSYTYTNFRSATCHNNNNFRSTWCDTRPYACVSVVSPLRVPALRQHVARPNLTESEYEEMTSDFCTLPKKKMRYRMKQRVFEKSLNAILMEAKREIIEESSGDEHDDTYVHEARDNIYEELNLSQSFVDQIYEEIV